ncbi:MAG: PTS sugar transporter subunit IIA [Micrococcales bacterium]|nr:PTS sugar transporter subunit IIA [Micrococcales bacterium]
MGLLADAFGEGSILIKESVQNRSAAIEIAGELLVQSGKAKHSYVASMLDAVERFGPYIVIAPGIALAHGKPSEDVIETGLSLLVLKQAIEFQHAQNDPVQLVFGLAATDHESHIETMAKLAELLSDQDRVSTLLTSSDSEQIRVLLG